jgi:hypothetical protein
MELALSLSLCRPGGISLEQLVAGLFSAGEQGAWYDPSNRSTLFQDSAGTLPVTEVEQPVGLMLDRRKGLAVSTNAGNASATGQFTTPSAAANQVTGDIDIRARAILQSWASGSTQSMVTKRDSGGSNMGYALRVNTTGELSLIFGTSSTTFATATSSAATGFAANSTNWIRVTRNSSTGDVLFYTSANGSTWSQLGTTISTASGNIYASTSALIVGTGSGFAEPCVGKIYRAQVYAGAVLQVDFDPTRYAGGSTFVAATGETWTLAGTTGSITPDGNHAYQTTSSARPHLRSRYNLLTYSEQLDNAAWTKQGYVMTANTVVAPDGTTTAETAADNTTSTFHWFRQDITVTAGSTYTFSAYLKYNDQRYVGLAFFSTAVNNVDRVLLLDMTQTDPAQMVVQQDAGVTSNIQSVGNGWYRVSMTFTMLSAGTLWYLIVSSNTNSYPVSYSGTGKSVYVWGAQLNLGSTAMSYQRIAAAPTLSQPPTYATTSTMGGEVFRPYLFFDGADSLLTANIDMSATDEVTVSAGLRKLSDATQGALVEFSSSANNAGAFGLICPVATTPADNLVFRSTGTTAIRDALTSGYPAPTDPLVLSGIGDVGSNVCQVRVNAVLKTSNTSSQGATNYLNAPLYIGSRNNASTYYNGNIYALIVRGKTSTAGELASLESYVASKTGVTL